MVNKEAGKASSRDRGPRSPRRATAHHHHQRSHRSRSDDPDSPHRHHRYHHRHHHAHDDNPSIPESEGERPRIVLITLQDLDQQRETITFAVKIGVTFAKLDRILRIRTKYPISDDCMVIFYRDGIRLNPASGYDEGTSEIWYRVSSGLREDISIKVSQWDEDQNWPLGQSLRDELAEDIKAGITVGDLRAKIANELHIIDANRIILTAMRGMRNGHIYGNAWEVRQLQKWLCQEIAVHVCPEQKYFVLRGFDRDYICHQEVPRSYQTEVVYIKNFILNVLKNVHLTRNSKISLDANEIKVIYGNRIKRNTSTIPWGSTIKFTVPDDIASIFEANETCLLPLTGTCSVCGDDKRVTEMPKEITADCDHRPSTCKDCLQQWIKSSMDTTEWNRLKCPECSQYLQFHDVRRYASQEVFIRYDQLATRAAVKDIRNFRWCLATTCDSGQIVNEDCPKFKCHVCKHRHCTHHNVPWHRGETCEEYDRRNRQKTKDDKASERVIKETSKKCPKCNKDVYKYTGCNHITCVCQHEWCYLCFAPFERTNHGFLYCRHRPECTERDPFLEFVEGPQDNPFLRQGPRRNNFDVPRHVEVPNIVQDLLHRAMNEEFLFDNARDEDQVRAPAPPMAPPPPRFAVPPHRVRVEIEQFAQHRANMAAIRDAAREAEHHRADVHAAARRIATQMARAADGPDPLVELLGRQGRDAVGVDVDMDGRRFNRNAEQLRDNDPFAGLLALGRMHFERR